MSESGEPTSREDVDAALSFDPYYGAPQPIVPEPGDFSKPGAVEDPVPECTPEVSRQFWQGLLVGVPIGIVLWCMIIFIIWALVW